MSKLLENKEKQGFHKKYPCCGNCVNYSFEIKEKISKYDPHYTYTKEWNMKCTLGSFEVGKSNWCREHEFKQ